MGKNPCSVDTGFGSLKRYAVDGFTFRGRFAVNGFTFRRRSAVNGFTFHRRSAVNGFTLIEMMVALAVFSLAAMALIRLEGATIRSTGILDETLVAQMVARNVAVETMTDAQPPAIGPTSGSESNGGRTWNWTRQTKALGDAFRIDIMVSDGAGPPIGHLTIIRPSAAVGVS